MSENQAPWDLPSNSETLPNNKHVQQNPLKCNEANSSSLVDDNIQKIYGNGKPQRIQIVGDIKSVANE